MGKKGKGEEEVVVPARLWGGGRGRKVGKRKWNGIGKKSLHKKERPLFRSFSSTEKAKKVKLCVSVLQRHILNGKFAEENERNIDATQARKRESECNVVA